MPTRAFMTLLAVALLSVHGAAQGKPSTPARGRPQPEAAQTPKPAAPTQAARPDTSQPVNIRIELTITDQTGPGEPSRKVVTMVVADQRRSSIRTSGWVFTQTGRRDVAINVDAGPDILKDGSIRLDLALEYQPRGLSQAPVASGEAAAENAQTTLTERISTIMENGISMIVSQAADPIQDRRISIEVKATVVK